MMTKRSGSSVIRQKKCVRRQLIISAVAMRRRSSERTDTLLNHPDLDIRISAMTWAAGMPDVAFQPSAETVRSLLTSEGPAGSKAKVAAAKIAARLPAHESIALLRELIQDADPAVAGAAMLAAGNAGHKELIFDLLPMLTKSEARGSARQALLMFGCRYKRYAWRRAQ